MRTLRAWFVRLGGLFNKKSREQEFSVPQHSQRSKEETHMRKALSSVMIVVGVGLLVLGFSAYSPAGSGQLAGWSDSCRITIGAMLAVGGWLPPR